MEAIEFLKEAKRKCSSTTCDVCQIERLGVMCVLLAWSDEKLEQLVSEVEQWSKEHTIVTNAQKFKEVFGVEAIYAISSPNVQALKDWLDKPYKEPEHED